MPDLTPMLLAVIWSTVATVVSQAIAISLMWWLGLPPKRLAHELEDTQNSAVGASFFIVSLTVGLFISIFVSNGFTPGDVTYAAGAIWIGLALLVGTVLMWISFEVAHSLLDRVEGESTYRYIQRELIEEHNTAMAFFLGGLAVVPFIAAIFQMI